MALSYMLDTNICIYITKQRPAAVYQRFTELAPAEVGMSLITYGELRYGANKSQQRDTALAKLSELQNYITVLSLAPVVTDYYSDIRATLEQQGTPIGNNDLWIAAHALALDVTLVTNNVREFQRVDKLRLENWVAT